MDESILALLSILIMCSDGLIFNFLLKINKNNIKKIIPKKWELKKI